MDTDPLRKLDRYFAERAQKPFGDLEKASGRTLQRLSIAGQQAASNLLVKASRALDGDEPERARAYADRAVRLPYDEHEGADEHDTRWLYAAIGVLAAADEAGRCTMRDVLASVDNDYNLSRAESVSLRSAVAAVPDRSTLKDLDLRSDELGDCVMSILAISRDYRAALTDRA